jgi:hypothetical protein
VEHGSKPFDRALNTHDLPSGLGDPERWGGTALLRGSFAANAHLNLTLTSNGQLVRAQCKDLLARQWLILATYENDIDDPSNSGLVTLTSIELDIAWGVGQVSTAGPAKIFPVPLNAGNAWTGSATAGAGVVEVANVPASALSVLSARAVYADAGAPSAVQIRLRVSVTVAPRSV